MNVDVNMLYKAFARALLRFGRDEVDEVDDR